MIPKQLFNETCINFEASFFRKNVTGMRNEDCIIVMFDDMINLIIFLLLRFTSILVFYL